jgi:hypothetical protein
MNAVTKVSTRGVLKLPGTVSRTSLQLPEGLTFEQWAECGRSLMEVEGSVQWWIGDWWAYGEHKYAERKAATELGGILEDLNFKTAANYGWVSNKVETSRRREVLETSSRHELRARNSLRREVITARCTAETSRQREDRFRSCTDPAGEFILMPSTIRSLLARLA